MLAYFGKVEQGELLTHEFIFKNEGDAPLVIEKITTSCGCTAALASEDKIEPGREGKIKASLNSRPRIELDRYNIDLGLSLERDEAATNKPNTVKEGRSKRVSLP